MKEFTNLLTAICIALCFILVILLTIPLFILRFIFLKWKTARELCEKATHYLNDILDKII